MHFFTLLICKFLMVMFALISSSFVVNGNSAEDFSKNLKVPPRFGKRFGMTTDYGNESPKYDAVKDDVFEPVSSPDNSPSAHPSPLMVKYFCRLIQLRLISPQQCYYTK